MISRRNIRVKVMQLLYMIEAADSQVAFKKPVEELQKQLDKSRELFVYLLYFLTEVARYAETSAQKRASRNLPSEDDLNVNIKIAGNEFLWQILENPSFKKAIEIDQPQNGSIKSLLKRSMSNLTETDKYKEYIALQSREKAKEKEIIKLIFVQLMLPNESFIGHLEELFNNWDDDADMMDQLMLNYIQKPGSYNLQEMLES
jgi:N utilization substance protein B